MPRLVVRAKGVRSGGSTSPPRTASTHLEPTDLVRNCPTDNQLALLRIITSESDSDVETQWQACSAWVRVDETPPEQVRYLPAVGARLSAANIDDPKANRLRVLARHAQVSSLLQRRVLADIARLFLQHDIPMMALKGAATSILCPAGPPKPMADVDGLVPVEKAELALALLKKAGWMPDGNLEAQARRSLAFGHGWGFRRGEAQFDLHWHAAHQDPTARFDELLRSGSRRIELGGVPIELPSATGLLLQVCIHGIRWNYGGISSWPLDVVRILRNPDSTIDWETLFATCVERRLILQVRSALGALQGVIASDEVDRLLARLSSEPVPPIEVLEHRGITGHHRATLSVERAARSVMLRKRRENQGKVLPILDWRRR
jgi:hypothetical protein